MSDCPEYLRLHQLYIHALRQWEKANALRGVRDLDSAEEERVESFRTLCHHKEYCQRCKRENDQETEIH